MHVGGDALLHRSRVEMTEIDVGAGKPAWTQENELKSMHPDVDSHEISNNRWYSPCPQRRRSHLLTCKKRC
jgi:hypothetical protein